MKELFIQLFTETDNRTQDIFRWLAVLSVLTGLGLMVFAVAWNGQTFDMQQFGIGIGTLLAGVGVALKLKPEAPMNVVATQTTFTQTTTEAKETP